MTASDPFIDQRTTHRNTPDWCVVVRQGDGVRVHRFSNEGDARAFAAEFDATDPEDETPAA
jgi:hypothetical protein